MTDNIVTLYQYPYPDQNNHYYTILNDLGERNNMFNMNAYLKGSLVENKKTWWQNEFDSINIKPGYEWCGWKDTELHADTSCYNSTGNDNVNRDFGTFRNEFESMRLRLDCSHDANKWVAECNTDIIDEKKYKDNCKTGSTCYQNKTKECSNESIDLSTNANCKKFCAANPAKCPDQILKYCKKLDMPTLIKDDMCKDIKTNISKEKCKTDSTLFNTDICKEFCKGKPTDCINVANQYCSTNMETEECKNFCSFRPERCINGIRNFCVNDNIIKPICISMLSSPEMAGIHYEEMGKYCNNSPNKTNSICNCENKEAISNAFKTVTDDIVKENLIKRPDCFYRPCVLSSNVYKLKDQPCPNLSICKKDLAKINITKLCQGTQSDNCIKFKNDCGSSTDSKNDTSTDYQDDTSTDYKDDTSSSSKKNEPTDDELIKFYLSSSTTPPASQSQSIFDTITKQLSISSLSQQQNTYLQMSTILICCCCCCLLLFLILKKKK
jgi:hypothetical protein